MAKHWSEDIAKDYLLEQNYILLAQNYYVRGGEIDLIMKDQEVLVFVEVKQRKSLKYGSPAEMINYAKLQRMQNVALDYMQKEFSRDDMFMRFDAVLLLGREKDYRLEHIQNISL